MKNIFFLFLGLFFFLGQASFAQEDFRKSAPPAGPAPRIELGEADMMTFKNGLKVIVVENHKLPRLSFQVFVNHPPILEGEDAGYVDMAGQMLSRGTTNRSKAQIDEEVDFIGANLNTSSTGVTIRGLSKHKDKMLDIMLDVLYNPTFPEEEFEKIRTQTLSALAQSKDDPNTIAANVAGVLRNSKKHPYGEVVTEETVNNIKVEKCKEFYETYFHPNISYLIITGDITKKEATELASLHFSKWEKAATPFQAYDLPRPPQVRQVGFVDKPGAVQSVINITYPVILVPGDKDAIKASVMRTLLGGYFSSRLNANLREDKGYTYGARAVLDSDPRIGYFNAYASVRNEVTDSSLVEFLHEIEKLTQEEVSDAELEMVKNVMTGSFARSLERPETMARYQLNVARYNLPKDYYATYLEKLSKVSKADILEMSKKYLRPNNAHILVVGNKDEVADKLKQFSPEAKVNFYDAYGNYLDDAGLAIPEGITAEDVLEDYLNAVGGRQNLDKIKDVVIEMSAEMQGMTINSTLFHKAPNKLALKTKMMGNVMQSSTFDGEKGTNMQMGTFTPMEGSDLEDMRIDSRLFPERTYKEMGVKTSLKSIELVNGKKAYKIVIEYPSGSKKTHYFDMESSLKVKEIETRGDAQVTNEIGDYREVNGILFPHKTTVSGGLPIPLTLTTNAVEVNTDLDAELFKVE